MDNASDILSRIGDQEAFDRETDRSSVVVARPEEEEQVEAKNNAEQTFRRSVVLRERVSLADHLHRLYFLLTWSDRNGGRWMGIKRFLDCYFSLVFHPYFGDRFKVTILHIAKRSKICCHFQLGVVSDFSSYTLLIMLNYPLWDKLLQVSTALPNRYFRRSVRTLLRKTEQQQITTDENTDSDSFTYLMNVSLAALCLVDRLEFSMQPDLERYGATHVVTVSKFFSNAHDAKNLFNTISLVE